MARPAQEIPDRSGIPALDNPFLLAEPAPAVERWGRALAGAVTVAGAALVLTGTAAADTEDGPGGVGRDTPTSVSSSGAPTSTAGADTGTPPVLLDATAPDQDVSTPPAAPPTGTSDLVPEDGTTTAGDGPDPVPDASGGDAPTDESSDSGATRTDGTASGDDPDASGVPVDEAATPQAHHAAAASTPAAAGPTSADTPSAAADEQPPWVTEALALLTEEDGTAAATTASTVPPDAQVLDDPLTPAGPDRPPTPGDPSARPDDTVTDADGEHPPEDVRTPEVEAPPARLDPLDQPLQLHVNPDDWPSDFEPQAPPLIVSHPADFGGRPAHPNRASFVEHLRREGAEDLKRLFESTYDVATDEDWRRAITDVAARLRKMMLDTRPLTPDEITALFPRHSEEEIAQQPEGPSRDSLRRLDEHNAAARRYLIDRHRGAFDLPEVGCWLVCRNGTAVVLPRLAVGNPSDVVAPALSDRDLRNTQSAASVHVHGVRSWETTGLSDGDQAFADQVARFLQRYGHDVDFAEVSVDVLTGTTTIAEPDPESRRWAKVEVTPAGAGWVSDVVNMSGEMVPTRGPLVTRPWPMGVVPPGTSERIFRRAAAALEPTPDELAERARSTEELREFDARLAAAVEARAGLPLSARPATDADTSTGRGLPRDVFAPLGAVVWQTGPVGGEEESGSSGRDGSPDTAGGDRLDGEDADGPLRPPAGGRDDVPRVPVRASPGSGVVMAPGPPPGEVDLRDATFAGGDPRQVVVPVVESPGPVRGGRVRFDPNGAREVVPDLVGTAVVAPAGRDRESANRLVSPNGVAGLLTSPLWDEDVAAGDGSSAGAGERVPEHSVVPSVELSSVALSSVALSSVGSPAWTDAAGDGGGVGSGLSLTDGQSALTTTTTAADAAAGGGGGLSGALEDFLFGPVVIRKLENGTFQALGGLPGRGYDAVYDERGRRLATVQGDAPAVINLAQWMRPENGARVAAAAAVVPLASALGSAGVGNLAGAAGMGGLLPPVLAGRPVASPAGAGSPAVGSPAGSGSHVVSGSRVGSGSRSGSGSPRSATPVTPAPVERVSAAPVTTRRGDEFAIRDGGVTTTYVDGGPTVLQSPGSGGNIATVITPGGVVSTHYVPAGSPLAVPGSSSGGLRLGGPPPATTSSGSAWRGTGEEVLTIAGDSLFGQLARVTRALAPAAVTPSTPTAPTTTPAPTRTPGASAARNRAVSAAPVAAPASARAATGAAAVSATRNRTVSAAPAAAPASARTPTGAAAASPTRPRAVPAAVGTAVSAAVSTAVSTLAPAVPVARQVVSAATRAAPVARPVAAAATGAASVARQVGSVATRAMSAGRRALSAVGVGAGQGSPALRSSTSGAGRTTPAAATPRTTTPRAATPRTTTPRAAISPGTATPSANAPRPGGRGR